MKGGSSGSGSGSGGGTEGEEGEGGYGERPDNVTLMTQAEEIISNGQGSYTDSSWGAFVSAYNAFSTNTTDANAEALWIAICELST